MAEPTFDHERFGQEPHLTHLHAIFDAMIRRLGSVVPDLGRETAGDATSLNARRKKDVPRHEQTKRSPIARALYEKVKQPPPPRRRRPVTRERQARLKFAG